MPMSQVFQVVSHWSASNPIAEQLLDLAIQREIDAQWLSKRYRRLAFYFFQKEITSDIREKLSPSYLHIGQTITDPEIQSLVARSALGHIATETIAIYPSTILINDYLLGQENFAYDNSESDAIFAKKFLSLLNKKNAPAFLLNTTKNRVSDVLLVLRRRRADLILIKNLLDGQYGYRTLVQACGEYLAQYACVPLIFDYLQKNRSSDSFLYFLEEDTQLQLRTLLTPQYELVAQIIPLAHTYGSVSLEKSPYATSFARL